MALVTLQTIFQDAYPASEQTHPLPAHVRRAARAILQCRTAALGGPIQACPAGHMARVWYNACRHRSCPHCAALQTERWVALQQARLLACDHSHVIFTLPHDRTPLWLTTVAGMPPLLLQAVRDTLGTRLAAPQSLGAQPGLLAALHTWSQTLGLPPHVHWLVTGGGRPPDGQWQAIRNGCLLPVRVVMAVLRGTLLAARRQALAREGLGLPEAIRPQQMLTLRTRLGHPRKTQWNVPMRERSRHGAGVGTSLARSLRGGPSKNARLVADDGARVPCTCRPRQAEADGASPAGPRLPVSVADFLQRWLLHVPVPQTRVVRSYGLSHPTPADALAVCRAALGQPPVAAPVAVDWQTVCAQRGALHPEGCPTCGQRLVCTGVIPRGGLRLASPQRSAPHDHAMGRAMCQGRWVPGGDQGTGHHGVWAVPQGVTVPGTTSTLAQRGAAGPVPSRMPWGFPPVHSLACGWADLVRPHRYAVRPTRR
jgi:hypothetical protein